MADGSTKRIDQIRAGDRVISTDPDTGATSAQTVSDVIVGDGEKTLVDITVETRRPLKLPQRSTLTATDGHPIFVKSSNAWVVAGGLEVGEQLSSRGPASVEVAQTVRRNANARVFNLTVDNTHTYYVVTGTSPILVHNIGGDPGFNIAGDYTGRVDRFNYRSQAYFEVHVFYKGAEVGIYGSNGWIGKHGHPADMKLWQDVENRLKGVAVDEMRRAGRLGSGEDIKGDAWKRPHVDRLC